MNVEAAESYGVDKAYYRKIKKGDDITLENGSIIPNSEITSDPPQPKSYAYCSDTAYFPELIPRIKNVKALYHEATFLERDSHLAGKTRHSTAKEAATIALEAKVGQLILGHYSTRYKDLEPFLTEAKEVFANTHLAEEGKTFEL